MANRRMFSVRLINSARFLKMPISCQALYFHLGLNADDDGVVEAYNVIKSVGCTEDDLRVLVSKGFVRVLNEDLVSYITDWQENNSIRPDRKIDSIYKDLLLSIIPDAPLIEKKQRADRRPVEKTEENAENIGDEQPWDNHGTTMGQHRLGKDRLGKDSIGEVKRERAKATRFTPPTLEEVTAYCQERSNNVDPQRFIDFYESKGWMVGSNKMKDWKAAVRTWERRDARADPESERTRKRHQKYDELERYYLGESEEDEYTKNLRKKFKEIEKQSLGETE